MFVVLVWNTESVKNGCVRTLCTHLVQEQSFRVKDTEQLERPRVNPPTLTER